MSWKAKKVISTPKGDYTPISDDLTKELYAAAGFCGFADFTVFISGQQVEDPRELHTNSIAALLDGIAIEGVEPIRVGSYQKPA